MGGSTIGKGLKAGGIVEVGKQKEQEGSESSGCIIVAVNGEKLGKGEKESGIEEEKARGKGGKKGKRWEGNLFNKANRDRAGSSRGKSTNKRCSRGRSRNRRYRRSRSRSSTRRRSKSRRTRRSEGKRRRSERKE